MQTEFLIIGQGISGTWLSYYLQNEGKSFIVIDDNNNKSPSRISAGIINPVTGRRHVTVWMADKIIPFALKAYNQLGYELGITAISQKNIIEFFPSPQMRLSFLQRIEENDMYMYNYPEQNHFKHLFNYDFGCGEIQPAYTVHLETLLPAWRQRLREQQVLLEIEFEIEKLQINKDNIQYNDITADKIIFCDGNSSAAHPWFKQLPFAPNKGEILLVEIPDLPNHHVYKKGMMLAPLATTGLWWLGSNYGWNFDTADPTTEFRERTVQLLKEWLKIPFTITEHLSGIRPATLERRPFVGIHPLHSTIGILNGMGTKGCSLSPFFAKQLTEHFCKNHPIFPEADINRFSKIIARNSK